MPTVSPIDALQTAITCSVGRLAAPRFAPVERLRDGTLGWNPRLGWPPDPRMPRVDDCFAAALATCLQVPIDDVPDPRIDERLAAGETPEEIDDSALGELADWLARRGLSAVLHRRVPSRSRRWIGVVPSLPGAGPFKSHWLVLDRGELLWDPSAALLDALEEHFRRRRMRVPSDTRGPADVSWGFSFRATPVTRSPNGAS